MLEFYQTGMGKNFYDIQVPRIAKALERIALSLEEQNASTKEEKKKDKKKQILKERENKDGKTKGQSS